MRAETIDKLVMTRAAAINGIVRFAISVLRASPTLKLNQFLNLVGDVYHLDSEDVRTAAVEAYNGFKSDLGVVVSTIIQDNHVADLQQFVDKMHSVTTLDTNAILEVAASVLDVSPVQVEKVSQCMSSVRTAALKKWSWDVLDSSWEIIDVEGCKKLRKKESK